MFAAMPRYFFNLCARHDFASLLSVFIEELGLSLLFLFFAMMIAGRR